MKKVHKNTVRPRRHQKCNRPANKIKLLRNGKIAIEGTHRQLAEYLIEDDYDEAESYQNYENMRLESGLVYIEQFKHYMRVYKKEHGGRSFDWRKMFPLNPQNREELALRRFKESTSNVIDKRDQDWRNLKSLFISQSYQYYGGHYWTRQLMTAYEVDRLLENEWPALEKLSLCTFLLTEVDNQFGNPSAEILLKTPSLPKLKQLDISKNNITAHGLSPIVNARFIGLTLLSLEFNLIGSTGVKLLVKAELPNLEILKLAQCGFGDEGARHLIKGHWPNLQQIRINQNHLGLTGYQAITLNHWPQLKKFQQAQYKCGCCGLCSELPGIGIQFFDISILELISCRQTSLQILNKYKYMHQQFLTIFGHRNAKKQQQN